MKLKPELGLTSAILYGIGVIVGAGIYSLIGIGAGLAGNLIWLAFLVGGIIALFTSLSYAELSTIFTLEAAEYHYTKKAFKSDLLAFIIGWILVAAGVFFASTVALGFAGYLSAIIGGDTSLIALILIIIMGCLNYFGIRISTIYNNFCAIISVIGLLIIAFLAFGYPSIGTNYFEPPSSGLVGFISALSVVFFASIGFENIANISEEIKDNRSVVPKAIVISVIISALLYTMISIAALHVVSWEELSNSSAPLALVVSRASHALSILIYPIALFATSNTVLIALTSVSRILFGMSRSKSMPKAFSHLSRFRTPSLSIALSVLAACAVVYLGDIKTAAQLTNLGVFVTYFAVNLSLLSLRNQKSHFKSPRVAGIPILAIFGALTSLFMIIYLGTELWLVEFLVILIGLGLYFWPR